MKNNSCRAWQFLHPDFSSSEGAPGLRTLPTGSIAMVEEEASIRQAILLLLSTSPGERVMRPSYGCELHKLIFSPNDETSAGLAIHYVRRALELWEPRVDIVHLDALRDEDDPARLTVYLEYRVRMTQHLQEASFSINLAEA
ncbi:MAG TPA: GPW/gp25 family protein [Terrimicrobiaceae bacterium]|nr:GPW/gp25 family protein [Terrimicrobiaceae bacterium]